MKNSEFGDQFFVLLFKKKNQHNTSATIRGRNKRFFTQLLRSKLPT